MEPRSPPSLALSLFAELRAAIEQPTTDVAAAGDCIEKAVELHEELGNAESWSPEEQRQLLRWGWGW